MNNECSQIKNSIYAGMSIFNKIKYWDFVINNIVIKTEDKKYISLYLGILNTKNNVSDKINKEDSNKQYRISFNYLTMKEYLKVYEMYFIDILKNVDFNDLDAYFNYLNSIRCIKEYNKFIGISFNNEERCNKKVLKI